MPFPQSHGAFREALLAWTPHPSVAEAILQAHDMPSASQQAVHVFTTLRGRVGAEAPPAEGEDATPVLDTAGLKLLAGACFLISSFALYGYGAEALTELLIVQAALPPGEV